MNWNDLATLLELSRCTTMSEAARRLGVNQTTVSRRIEALEEALDVKLVRRSQRGIVLTDEGCDAARAVEGMEATVHGLERRLLGRASELAGSVRVTCHPMLAQHHADLFSGFAARFPRVALEVEADRTARSLAGREADVALRIAVAPSEGLFGRKLARAEYALYASKALRERVGPRASLSKYPWLAFTPRMGARLIDAWMRKHLRDPTVVCRYEDSLTMHAAIRAGAGVGFMPCAFGDPDPGLVRLRGVQKGFGVDVWCLTHADLTETSRVRAFLAHAGDYFDAHKALYAGRRSRGAGRP